MSTPSKQGGESHSLPTATQFFRRLSDLLTNTEVTGDTDNFLSLDEGAARVVDLFVAVARSTRKVMLIGNGGSAAIVSHIHNDLCKALGARAMVFTETPLLTAISNDHGYETVYERQVRLWSEPGDLLLAVSSSGQSPNILLAVQAAAERDCEIVTFSGFQSDNPLRRMGHLNFYAPAESYGPVEMAHACLGHFLSDAAVQRSVSQS